MLLSRRRGDLGGCGAGDVQVAERGIDGEDGVIELGEERVGGARAAPEVEPPRGGEVERRGAPGEAVDGDLRGGGVPVAARAEEECGGGGEAGRGGEGAAGVAERGAHVPAGEGVGRVDVAVAGHAQARGVGAAMERRRGLAAVVAGSAPPPPCSRRLHRSWRLQSGTLKP